MAGGVVSFRHSGDMGDIVAGMAAVREFCAARGVRARLLLDTSGAWDCPACVRQSGGIGMKFGEAQFAFLAPLLRAQPFVESVEVWDKAERPDVDLNSFRGFLGRPFSANLLYAHQRVLGQEVGYRGPWLDAPPERPTRAVLVARSNRYHSSDQLYNSNREKIRAFVGTDLEHAAFADCTRIVPERVPVADALELAAELAAAKLLLVNGTLAYWIALGVGCPRIMHEVGIGIRTTVFREAVPGLSYVVGSRIVEGKDVP